MLIRILSNILFTVLLCKLTYAKVDPPNYDFSLDKFKTFMPGQKKSDIEKEYKYKESTFKEGDFETYKYYVEHIRYKFAIFVQYNKGVVTDFHARLPQYFLHDIFHQSLINRLGAQDIYKKVEEQAVYVWKNKNNLRHYYSGGCTITCFPIFYAVRTVKHSFGDGYKPLINRFRASSQKTSKQLDGED